MLNIIYQQTALFVIVIVDPLNPPVFVDYHVLNWDHLYFAWSENVSGRIFLPINYSAWYKNR